MKWIALLMGVANLALLAVIVWLMSSQTDMDLYQRVADCRSEVERTQDTLDDLNISRRLLELDKDDPVKGQTFVSALQYYRESKEQSRLCQVIVDDFDRRGLNR